MYSGLKAGVLNRIGIWINNETRSRGGKWRGYALNLLLLVALVAGVHGSSVTWAAVQRVLQGVTLAGDPHRLPAHPMRPVLVHFWAIWCPICRAEQSLIAEIARGGGTVITIAMQSGKPEEVRGYMREQGIDFQVLSDPDDMFSRTWGVHAVPASFIITSDGQIRFVEVGYTSGMGLRLRLWWAGL